MTPLQRLEALDDRITVLQQPGPRLQPGLAPLPQRQHYFGDLAGFWNDTLPDGQPRRQRLGMLRREQLLAELELRVADQTLDNDAIFLLRTCLELPQPWQRRHLPVALRAQVYRPEFSTLRPNRRLYLRGALVIVANSPPGIAADPQQRQGSALLCSLSHGIEAFASLADLHVELCERLDDPQQSQPLLNLMPREHDRRLILQADRLRYTWFTEDIAQQQADDLIDVQQQRLNAAWRQDTQTNQEALSSALEQAADLTNLIGSRYPLATRYSLLLEKHLPAWLRNASLQGLSHIMQTLQELAGAIEQAAAPGLLTLEQFRQRHTLLEWTRQRLRASLLRDPGIDLAPQAIFVSVTLARRRGPLVNPLIPSGYLAVSSRPQVGDTVEMVPLTYRLDELALLNIAWFDIDYWLTARVHRADDSVIEGLSAHRVKQLVRSLDAGTGYSRFLRTHLLDSAEGRWRMEAHGRITRARMQAELAKARYAGHFLDDPLEQGYRWARAVIRYPNSGWRPTIEEHRIVVCQLSIDGHTVQGVLLLNAEVSSVHSLVLYTPDAPDRRAWRELRNARELLRTLRRHHGLRQYVVQRLPQADPARIDKLLLKGRLGPYVQRTIIPGDLFQACYRAEVRSLMIETDASSRTNRETLGEFSLNALRLGLDLVSLVLPAPAMSALAFGRMAISIWDGLEAMDKDDHEAMLHHAFAALSHATDGINSFAGSAVMRRALRGLPPQPPRPLPDSHEAAIDISKLRYRLDGIHGEAVYERISPLPGPDNYFIQDRQGRLYNVDFDGQRWRATDPRQPDAYLKLPLKRLNSGEWVVDSAVLWHDGLPELRQLLDDCALQPRLAGDAVTGEAGLFDANGSLYLQLGNRQLPVRRHLLDGHYHLSIPAQLSGAVPAWAVLQKRQDRWRIRIRQVGRSSDWLELPSGA